MHRYNFIKGEILYDNKLADENDISDFVIEGNMARNFENNWLILENEISVAANDDKGHWVMWCPKTFPDNIMVEWEFKPLREPGLCMFFFAAKGLDEKDLFDSSLLKRTGLYPQYHSSDINALHLSYFRRKWAEEREFSTCNLRKSSGFHLVAQGADPIPTVIDATSYRIRLVKYESIVQFSINDLVVLEWKDLGEEFGTVLNSGKIGFRQMAPMKAQYRNLIVSRAILKENSL